ncbi:hypothetical protein [Pseudovibrio exalbescens]|uniref:hypothetical protein n=1 Tax=Pseudovibrio exalbescens TaxID=197461 RepID=UPI0015E09256|nr:hypothetical protein [Pseudovibrio exalbescens]
MEIREGSRWQVWSSMATVRYASQQTIVMELDSGHEFALTPAKFVSLASRPFSEKSWSLGQHVVLNDARRGRIIRIEKPNGIKPGGLTVLIYRHFGSYEIELDLNGISTQHSNTRIAKIEPCNTPLEPLLQNQQEGQKLKAI